MRWAALNARAVIAVLAALLVGGCATVPRLPGERRDDRLQALETRLLELSQKAAVQEVELGRLRQKVAALEARLAERPAAGSATGPAAPGPAPSVIARPAAAGSAMTRPSPAPRRGSTGTLEETELEEAPVAPPTSVAPSAAAAPSAGTSPRASAPAPRGAPAAPWATVPVSQGEGGPVAPAAQAVYDEAYTLLNQGRYEQAEARFEEFLAQSPQSELSDNAQFWIGSARFSRGDFPGALAAFKRTVERYPGANKVPDALYKMGQSLEELHDNDQALAVYDELVRRFPDTAAASLATERRAKLRG